MMLITVLFAALVLLTGALWVAEYWGVDRRRRTPAVLQAGSRGFAPAPGAALFLLHTVTAYSLAMGSDGMITLPEMAEQAGRSSAGVYLGVLCIPAAAAACAALFLSVRHDGASLAVIAEERMNRLGALALRAAGCLSLMLTAALCIAHAAYAVCLAAGVPIPAGEPLNGLAAGVGLQAMMAGGYTSRRLASERHILPCVAGGVAAGCLLAQVTPVMPPLRAAAALVSLAMTGLLLARQEAAAFRTRRRCVLRALAAPALLACAAALALAGYGDLTPVLETASMLLLAAVLTVLMFFMKDVGRGWLALLCCSAAELAVAAAMAVIGGAGAVKRLAAEGIALSPVLTCLFIAGILACAGLLLAGTVRAALQRRA